MEITGYVAAVLIGISLGLIGGGGSILTVPVLVYIFHLQPKLATSYSLFIVGITSLVGAIFNFTKGLVDYKTALLFGISSISTVFFTRKFIVHAIPENLIVTGDFTLSASLVTMVLFAILMLLSSWSMIHNNKNQLTEKEFSIKQYALPKLMAYGIGVGLVTGLLGAGGGFLIIPTLVLLIGLPMKKAIGTSLLIIAMNSLLGFTGDIGEVPMDWKLLLTLTAIAIAGVFTGIAISKKISGEKLKKGFGWFVLLMGFYILAKELWFK